MQASGSRVPTDSIEAALERVFAREEYQWLDPAGPLAWARRQWDAALAWLNGLQAREPALFALVVAALAIAALLILTHLGVLAFRAATANVERTSSDTPALPPQPDPEVLAQRADALAAQGRYQDAVALLFEATLARLEARQAVRVHRSKTPAEYVPEASLAASGRSAFAELVHRLYAHLFGRASCSEPDWRAFRALAERIPSDVTAG